MDKDYARKALAAFLVEGQIVYAVPLRTTAKRRVVQFLIALPDRTIRDISSYVAILCSLRFDNRRGGVDVGRISIDGEVEITRTLSVEVFGHTQMLQVWYV